MRRYKSRRNIKSGDKYSFENSLWTVTTENIQTDPPIVDPNYPYQAVQTIVPATSVIGMTKAQHLDLGSLDVICDSVCSQCNRTEQPRSISIS